MGICLFCINPNLATDLALDYMFFSTEELSCLDCKASRCSKYEGSHFVDLWNRWTLVFCEPFFLTLCIGGTIDFIARQTISSNLCFIVTFLGMSTSLKRLSIRSNFFWMHNSVNDSFN